MRVLLSGYYGFGNTGDEAILRAMVLEWQALGHQPLALSADPERTSRKYAIPAYGRAEPWALLRALQGCDLLVSGGGGLLQDQTSKRTLQYYLGLIRLAKLLGKPAVIFNQSAGPLSSSGRASVARALRGVRVWVRDRQSQTLLRALGIEARLGGDPALLLRANPVGQDPQQVILAPRGGHPELTTRLVQLARRLQERGLRPLALAFQPSQDDPETELIARSTGCAVLSTSDPQVAIDHIAGSAFVVGVRLHALILAAAARIPFLGLAYDPKVRGFCEDAGAPWTNVGFGVEEVAEQVSSLQPPDWDEVAAMQERAKRSFLEAQP